MFELPPPPRHGSGAKIVIMFNVCKFILMRMILYSYNQCLGSGSVTFWLLKRFRSIDPDLRWKISTNSTFCSQPLFIWIVKKLLKLSLSLNCSSCFNKYVSKKKRISNSSFVKKISKFYWNVHDLDPDLDPLLSGRIQDPDLDPLLSGRIQDPDLFPKYWF